MGLLENSPDGQRLADRYFAPIRRQSKEVMDQFTSAELEVVSRYLAATGEAMAEQRELLISNSEL